MSLLTAHRIKLFPKSPGLFAIALYLVFANSCKQNTDTQAVNIPHRENHIIKQARAIFDAGHLKQCIIYLDSAYAASHDTDTYDLWAKYNFKATFYISYEKSLPKAMLSADSMLLVLNGKQQLYKNEYASAVFTKGNILLDQNNYNEAIKTFYDAKQFAQKNLDSCSNCQFSYQLGMVSYQRGNYIKALPYFHQAFAENSQCKANAGFNNLFVLPQSYLNTIGLCFEKNGNTDSAIYYYNKALNFVNSNAPRFPSESAFADDARGVIYGNLGGAYATINEFNEAEKYLRTSIALNKDAARDPTAHIKLAKLYIKFSHFKSADSVLTLIQMNLSPNKADDEGYHSNLLKWKKLKWEYFEKTGQTGLAYRYAQAYYKMRDSLNETTKALKSGDIDAGFRDVAQQYQLAFLNKSNELKTVYLSAIIVFSVMVLGILAMTVVYLKHSRKSVSKLTRQNQLISEHNMQMQKTLDALEQSQRENTRMMNIVAHDLRSPIGGITIAASRMLEDPTRSEKDHSMLNLIRTSGKNSLTLLSDLLHVNTRIEELNKELVDMNQLLHYCVDLLSLKAEEKGQRIELDAGHFTLYANREKMWRVVSNLITNAIKFSPGGATITVLMLKKEDNVLISVEDQGIGIPEQIQDKIFDMFTEFKRPGTIGEQPFGIGLAISKQIVEAHGGKIWFESKPDNGTSFYVELPINISKQAI